MNSLPLRGLPNFGNTCHINSVVQCLMATKTFRATMLRMNDPFHIMRLFSFRAHGSPVRAYREEYRDMLRLVQPVIRPLRVLDNNDAHEILGKLLSHLQEVALRTPALRTSGLRDRAGCRIHSHSKRRALCDYLHRNESLVAHSFYILQCSTVRCGRCAYEISNFEYHSEIHLRMNAQQRVAFDTAVVEHYTPVLVPDWICDRCHGKHPSSTRTVRLVDVPAVLIVLLDTTAYTDGHVSRDGGGAVAPTTWFFQDKLYTLRSVCNHRGSAEDGHYTAVVIHDRRDWFTVDDMRVETVAPHPTVDALFLVYEVVDPNVVE